MSHPQPPIATHFCSEWKIRRPYLYRYLQKEFVDDFFESGALRLSSFVQFSKHTDEQRLDADEGFGVVSNRTSDGGGQTLIASIGQGHNAYVLCSSTLYNKDIATSFETDSGFRIDNILEFANAISRHIPSFISGIDGPCHYLPQRNLARGVGYMNIEEMKTSDSQNIDMNKMLQATAALAGEDMLFLKQTRYSSQCEYRMLWNTRNTADEYLDIVCPEAVQFCTRFEDLYAENVEDDLNQ